MKVEFLQGYRGIATKEVHYEAGIVADIEAATANYLLELGRVVIVDENLIEATPAATKYALVNDVDLALVSGSGPKGRINISDVRKYLDD